MKNVSEPNRSGGGANSRISVVFNVILFIVVGLAFVAFGFCVYKFICESKQVTDAVTNMINNSTVTDAADVARLETWQEYFKQLQTYYKDVSNFQIVSLLYVLISSVIMGVLGLYVQEQKKKMDEIEKNRQDMVGKLNAIEEHLDEKRGEFECTACSRRIGEALMYASQIVALIDAGAGHNVISIYSARLNDCFLVLDRTVHYGWTTVLSDSQRDLLISQADSLELMLTIASKKDNAFYQGASESYLNDCKQIKERNKRR